MQIQGQYAPHGSSWYNSSAAEAEKQVKTSPGLLYAIAITNSNAAIRYAYLWDSLSATGAVILPPVPVGIGAQTIIWLPYAIPFTIGLRVSSSSTNATFTLATADFRIAALFK